MKISKEELRQMIQEALMGEGGKMQYPSELDSLLRDLDSILARIQETCMDAGESAGLNVKWIEGRAKRTGSNSDMWAEDYELAEILRAVERAKKEVKLINDLLRGARHLFNGR